MTTPTFASAISEFTEVRVYTPADPYYYTIDNRPLGDLITNAGYLADAADSARRSSLLNGLFAAVRNRSAFGTTRYVEGLNLTVSNTSVTIGPGTQFEFMNLSGGDATQIVKQATLPAPVTFVPNIDAVVMDASHYTTYAIEAKYEDFSGSTTGYPIYDNTSTLAPSSMLFGNLRVQLTQGSSSTSQSGNAPSVTAGWYQLYLIDVKGPTGGQTVLNVYEPTSPSYNSWGLSPTFPTLSNLPSNGTTTVTYGDNPAITQFPDGSTKGCIFHVPLLTTSLTPVFNPYKPLKMRLSYTGDVSANNFAVRTRYAYLGSGTVLTSPTYTTSSTEVIAAGTQYQLSMANLTNTIPTWPSVGKEWLRVILERIGADGTDSNTGNMWLTSLQVYQ